MCSYFEVMTIRLDLRLDVRFVYLYDASFHGMPAYQPARCMT